MELHQSSRVRLLEVNIKMYLFVESEEVISCSYQNINKLS